MNTISVLLLILVLLAGLQSIPHHLCEAAQLDVDGGFKVFRYITLPLLSFYIKLAVLLMVF